MDLGFHLAGYETLVANDFDATAMETFNSLIPGQVGIHGDVGGLNFADFHGADLVIGGPPCQGFSVAGKMDPNDPRSRHVWTFFRVVSEVRPRIFVMENVKHLAVNEKWAELRNNLRIAAACMGYKTEVWLLRASDFGVPQNRDRMFLVGSLGDVPSRPTPALSIGVPTVRIALADLPKYGRPGNDSFCTAGITLASNPILRRSPFAGMLFNGAGRPVNLDGPSQTLAASMGGNKTPIIDQQWLENPSKNWLIGYHKHLWDGGHPLGFNEAPEFLRRLTAEEAALLQSFPIGMNWAGGTSARFRQIGNAVPPGLAKAVALAVKKGLKSVEAYSGPAATFSEEDLMEMGQSQLQFPTIS
jgi:DNA (cytosine-5)-methyltransferase 1